MKNLLKITALIVAIFFIRSFASAHQVEIVQEFKPLVGDGDADLFVPLPLQNAFYQKIISEKNSGNATSVKTETVSAGSKQNVVRALHAHWKNVKEPYLKVEFLVETFDRSQPIADSSKVDFFLKPTPHVQTDGIVAQTSNKITKDLTNSDDKAKAIYEWIVENTFRDPKTRGCGFGDVKTLLISGNLGGKCADLNSLFVGLARAAGIPAREVWGLRAIPSQLSKVLGKEGDNSKSQHCRAEYYSINKKAWVPVDPADIRKVALEENIQIQDPKLKELRKKLFGTWEGNWVAYNYGRDFKFPGQKTKINYFMYPQLISKKHSPDGMDPAEVKYTITSHLVR